MKILEDGRIYGLRNFTGDDHQEVRFTRKRYDGSFSNGTTVEEVIRMLRDKFFHFNTIEHSEENTACIKMCEAMLRQMMIRLERKKDENRLKRSE